MITVEHLEGGYGKTPIIRDLQFEIQKGEFFALLGPNGSGKTTLFKLITGQLPSVSGSILIDGKPMTQLTKLEKARKIAVLAQESQVTFDFTVEEIVSLGRYPHQTGIFKRLSSEDRKVIDNVMSVTRIEHFRNAQFRILSGGEKQRVLLAKALAQEPEVLLLDEPTNHLDIKHTFQILNMLKEWQRTKSLTIFAILHDLNVASLYADRVALLHKGSFLEVGDVHTLRNENQLKKVYEVDIKTQAHPIVAKPQLLMTPFIEDADNLTPLFESFIVNRKENSVELQFNNSLRTLSNAPNGHGIQWLKHFCLVNQPFHENDSKLLRSWMSVHGIPVEQALGIGCHGNLATTSIVQQQINGVDVALLLYFGEAIHIFVFIDATLNDQTLFDFYMAATEAKMTACQQAGIHLEMGRMDCLAIAASQRYSNNSKIETSISREQIGQHVLAALKTALQKNVGKPTVVKEKDGVINE
ncbi:ATP-binding cassette domain-containing protein [Sporosarcina sp. Te-1]|uniref:ABC transporter ATP-binding protein n=1 Tax=Sporosarcina sp. Te-1 TaxID=2818390 RepID=UPI001A9F848B|nr:ATP-binding cassette domain-containing protein [Sporosarcina sp. Te-1]QTD40903.1 ATP-binding cassette domain-containing protein [Sporosarcina sp. Te-1]